MRKLISLLLSLLLLALPALAEDAPVFSRDAQALQAANAALLERYGLTPHLLGLFDVEIAHYGDVSTVRYLPRSRPHPSLAGEYLVLVSSDGAQAYWTHDDIDPAVWQSGALESPAWGAPQLTAYLTADSFEREYFDAPYIPTEEVFYANSTPLILSSRPGELTEEEIAAPAELARRAVQHMYGMSPDEAAALSLIGVNLHMYADGRCEWSVGFYDDATPDEINYSVLIDQSTNEILLVTTFTGGIG